MLFAITLTLLASVAFAAPQADVKQLDKLVDIAIAELAKVQPKTLNEVTLRGLELLKREQCQLKDGVFTCTAVANQATVSSPTVKEQKVSVRIPISAILNGNIFERFIVGEVEVEPIEQGQNGLFSKFWDKVKNALGKVGKEVGQALKEAAVIAADSAKQTLNAKAAELGGKAVEAIFQKIEDKINNKTKQP